MAYDLAFRKEVISTVDQVGVDAAATKFGVSRRTIYGWMKMRQAGGMDGLRPGSPIPKSSPTQLPDELVALIREAALLSPELGHRQIAGQIEAHSGKKISPSTICRKLSKEGLATPDDRKAHLFRSGNHTPAGNGRDILAPRRPGEILIFGEIWIVQGGMTLFSDYAVIDVFSRYAFLESEFFPAEECFMFASYSGPRSRAVDGAIAFFESHGLPVRSVLVEYETDWGIMVWDDPPTPFARWRLDDETEWWPFRDQFTNGLPEGISIDARKRNSRKKSPDRFFLPAKPATDELRSFEKTMIALMVANKMYDDEPYGMVHALREYNERLCSSAAPFYGRTPRGVIDAHLATLKSGR